MALIYGYLFAAMWLSYAAYWWAMSANVKVDKRSEPALSRLERLVLIACAAALLCLPRVRPLLLNGRFLPSGAWFWVGSAVTACGLLFSVWARSHLGKNWSQAVTVKKDHELITSGPYALVRHPTYTGFLTAFIGSALARGEWRGILAVILVFVALYRKLKLEEKWMQAQFGEVYKAYARRVSALVPRCI